MNEQVMMIPISEIIPNQFQSRTEFDEKAIQELAMSIKEHGLIQPLVLRKLDSKYEIISGERRFKASQIAGLTEVPAIVRVLTDQESAELLVAGNVQREDLSPIEEAKSYEKLLQTNINDHSELSQKLGLSEDTVKKKMQLLGLAKPVQDALLKKQISERHARSILKLKEESDQIQVLNEIINNRLTVKQTDEMINNILSKTIVSNLTEGEKPIDIEAVPTENDVNDIFKDEPSNENYDINSLLMPETSLDESNKNENEIQEFSIEENKDEYLETLSSQTNVNNDDFSNNNEFNVQQIINNGFSESTELNNVEPEIIDIDKDTNNESNIESMEKISNVDTSQINPFQETEILDLEGDNMYTSYKVSESKNENITDFNSVITNVKSLKEKIELAGFVVETQEYDFVDSYQIVFKIQK